MGCPFLTNLGYVCTQMTRSYLCNNVIIHIDKFPALIYRSLGIAGLGPFACLCLDPHPQFQKEFTVSLIWE